MPKLTPPKSDRFVRATKTDGLYALGGAAGLYLRIQSGTKCFVYRYTFLSGRHLYTIGSYPGISLEEARTEAHRLKALLKQGVDPLDDREAKRAEQTFKLKQKYLQTVTFGELADQYVVSREHQWTLKDHAQNIARYEKYVTPLIGHLPINSIATKDIATVLDKMAEKGCSRSLWGKVRSLMRQVFDWAKAQDIVTGDNPVSPSVLRHLLTRIPEQSDKHHAMLPIKDVPRFMASLHSGQSITAKCLEFAILTAVRSQNARLAEWSEINWERKEWCIPARKMKVGVNGDHIVPLSKQAIELLEQVKGTRLYSKYIFASPKDHGTLSDPALLKIIKDMHHRAVDAGQHGYTDPKQTNIQGKVAIATAHGIARASFRTWAQDDELGNDRLFSEKTAELCLHHKVDDTYNGAYNRNEAMQSRRQMMQAWADYCLSATEKSL